MKGRILLLILGLITVLGLKEPPGQQRGPVPDGQIVAHSIHCAGCHGFDQSGVALRDASGADVNMYDDWNVSMMRLSAYDPFWRATLQHEVALYPAAKDAIEQKCLKCHAPLGSQQRAYDGLDYAYADMLGDSLGLDGVSCVACHQQPPVTYGKHHSGEIVLNTERVIYGPHPDPFEGPMELYVGFTPVFTDLMYSSGVCAGCHTLITPTLDEDGVPTGDSFVEQATYHEWLNSSYVFLGVECQNCHMPLIEDSIILASDLKDLQKRSPFGLHQFYGANTAMLSMMRQYRDTLGLPVSSPDSVWNESIGNNRTSLSRAAAVRLDGYMVANDTLYTFVSVVNQTGHKLPSGYPSRIAWLQVLLLDDTSGDTLYFNGEMDAEGNIAGRDMPYEPHHEIALSSADVQIYEMVMGDINGQQTTRLSAAFRPLKDNRLLPLGFRTDHPVYDTVAIYGRAESDPEFSGQSAGGLDRIEYRIPLHGYTGFADLHIALRYHTFPSRWMQDLFESDSIPDVFAFKNMYAGYKTFTELIDQLVMEDLDLESSNTGEVHLSRISVFPNPVADGIVHIVNPSGQDIDYTLTDLRGAVLLSGSTESHIDLGHLNPGMYLLWLGRDEKQTLVKLIVL